MKYLSLRVIRIVVLNFCSDVFRESLSFLFPFPSILLLLSMILYSFLSFSLLLLLYGDFKDFYFGADEKCYCCFEVISLLRLVEVVG